MLERRANVEQPHPETCQWIFAREEYRRWRDGDRGLLWMKGKPGAGKSTIMSFLYSHLLEDFQKQHAICLEFFFSARGTELQYTPLGMLRSIMNQLFLQDTSIRDEMRRKYQAKCGPFGRLLQTEWQRAELEIVLQRMLLKVSQQQRVFIFIDALDESGEDSARAIAAYFHGINDKCAETKGLIKICISCRHYPVASVVSGHEIRVEACNYSDISRYIQDHLNLNLFLSDADSIDHTAWYGLEKVLADQAQGIFIWVCLVIPMVQKAMMDGQSPNEIKEWLREVPDDLAAVYRRTLKHVISQRFIERTLLLFVWTIMASRPLRLIELSYVMVNKEFPLGASQWFGQPKVSAEAIDRLKRQVTALSGGLIEVIGFDSSEQLPLQQSCVSVIHQSVSDFFTAEGFSILVSRQRSGTAKPSDLCSITNKWPRTVEDCHSLIYLTCLRRLTQQYEQDEPNEKDEQDELFQSMTIEIDPGDVASTSDPVRYRLSADFIIYARESIFVHRQKFESDERISIDTEIQILDAIAEVLLECVVDGDSLLRLRLHSDYSIMHIVTIAGLTSLLKSLIDDEGQIHIADRAGYTPLHHAARNGVFSSFKLLVEAGADIQQRTFRGETPMSLIMHEKTAHIFVWLYNRVSRIQDQQHILRKLVAEQWQTVIQQGNIAMTGLLLRHGVNVNMPLPVYGSALRLAVTKKDVNMVKFLVSRGARADTALDVDRPMLQWVIESSGSKDILDFLLQAGADINSKDRNLGTPLQAACYKQREDYLTILLNKGADVNQGVMRFDTPLQIAAQYGNEKIIKLLIHAGADVNLGDGGYGTPFQIASMAGHDRVKQLLMEAGATSRQPDRSWDTALRGTLRQELPTDRGTRTGYPDVPDPGGFRVVFHHPEYDNNGLDFDDNPVPEPDLEIPALNMSGLIL